MIRDARSLRHLEGVHPDLVRLATRALEIGPAHTVIDGRRTEREQEALLARGASWTMRSRHLTGHAIDVAPLPIRWDWPLFFPIARAFQVASRQLAISVVWGGVWDCELAELGDDLEEEVADYTARMRVRGHRPKLDGPHYELPRDLYP